MRYTVSSDRWICDVPGLPAAGTAQSPSGDHTGYAQSSAAAVLPEVQTPVRREYCCWPVSGRPEPIKPLERGCLSVPVFLSCSEVIAREYSRAENRHIARQTGGACCSSFVGAGVQVLLVARVAGPALGSASLGSFRVPALQSSRAVPQGAHRASHQAPA